MGEAGEMEAPQETLEPGVERPAAGQTDETGAERPAVGQTNEPGDERQAADQTSNIHSPFAQKAFADEGTSFRNAGD